MSGPAGLRSRGEHVRLGAAESPRFLGDARDLDFKEIAPTS